LRSWKKVFQSSCWVDGACDAAAVEARRVCWRRRAGEEHLTAAARAGLEGTATKGRRVLMGEDWQSGRLRLRVWRITAGRAVMRKTAEAVVGLRRLMVFFLGEFVQLVGVVSDWVGGWWLVSFFGAWKVVMSGIARSG
jgi:hypothetical protein